MKLSLAVLSLLAVTTQQLASAQSDCQCFQGASDVKGSWTDPSGNYGDLVDYGECGFIKVCNRGNTVVQLVLAGEPYFAVDSTCSSNGSIKTCAIDEFEINDAQALVHGGNAQISMMAPTAGLFQGSFLAGPDNSQDPHPGVDVFYASADFAIYNARPVECPRFGRGCD